MNKDLIKKGETLESNSTIFTLKNNEPIIVINENSGPIKKLS